MATSPDPHRWYVDDWATNQEGKIIILALTRDQRQAQVILNFDGIWDVFSLSGHRLAKDEKLALCIEAVKFLRRAVEELLWCTSDPRP